MGASLHAGVRVSSAHSVISVCAAVLPCQPGLQEGTPYEGGLFFLSIQFP